MSIDISFKLDQSLNQAWSSLAWNFSQLLEYFGLKRPKFWVEVGLFHFDPLYLYYECQIDNEEMMREEFQLGKIKNFIGKWGKKVDEVITL